jgi:hypothetical protein
MADSVFRKECYDIYDKLIGDKFQCEVIDQHTYSINYYPYAKKISIINLNQALTQIHQLSEQKIDILSITKDQIIKEYTKISEYVGKPEMIVPIIEHIDTLYDNYGFCQGSSGVGRLLSDNGFVFYDYIAIYKILPIYTGIYRDLAQVYVSITDKNHLLFLKKWCEKKDINFDLVKILSQFEDESFL